jgi:hypothetical protein
MSLESDYLNSWIQKAAVREPSITRVSVQRWPGVGPPPNYKPGIVGYGWGINGTRIVDSSGTPTGLRFLLDVWFSDRGLDLSNPPPDIGQQFLSSQMDKEVIELRTVGEQVQLLWESITWGGQNTYYSSGLDSASQQLMFNVPGAGPNAPEALLLLSLADTGQFGWL